jgi:hypothetical protein
MDRKSTKVIHGRLRPEERLVQAANTRAFELYVASKASTVKVPWRAFTSATVAIHDEGQKPTIVVLVGLRRIAWLGVGLVHFWAWWRVSSALDTEIKGYAVKVWAN